VNVANGHVTKKGDDIVDSLSPFHESDIMPENTLVTDSTQALQIAETLLPGISASSSQMELDQKSLIPTWRVTLWVKTETGEDVEVGTVSILAESGSVSAKPLKLDRLNNQ